LKAGSGPTAALVYNAARLKRKPLGGSQSSLYAVALLVEAEAQGRTAWDSSQQPYAQVTHNLSSTHLIATGVHFGVPDAHSRSSTTATRTLLRASTMTILQATSTRLWAIDALLPSLLLEQLVAEQPQQYFIPRSCLLGVILETVALKVLDRVDAPICWIDLAERLGLWVAKLR